MCTGCRVNKSQTRLVGNVPAEKYIAGTRRSKIETHINVEQNTMKRSRNMPSPAEIGVVGKPHAGVVSYGRRHRRCRR